MDPRSRNPGGPAPRPVGSRVWQLKKQTIRRDLEQLDASSPVLELLAFSDLGREIRALLAFLVPTLIAPGRRGELRTSGPVLVGLRYAEEHLTTPPLCGSQVCILEPRAFFHPNAGAGNGLCLGFVRPAAPISLIVHVTYAAITLNSCSTVEWEGLNPVAARWVRANAEKFPLVPSGLFEEPPADLVASARLESTRSFEARLRQEGFLS